MAKYLVVFDEVVRDKMLAALADASYKSIIKKWLDLLESHGTNAGKLLDNHVWLYELKCKKPPLRLYYHVQKATGRIIIFELEMKTDDKKQKKTIGKLRHRLSRFLSLFVYTLSFLGFPNTRAGEHKAWCSAAS